MAVSVYDKTFLNGEQQKKLEALTEEWNKASASGDQAGMKAAHSAAEEIRAGGGYSGGTEGTGYTKLSSVDGGYKAAELPTYKAQTEAVNDVYDAQRQLQLAQLKSAYDKNAAELDAEKAKIPGRYKQQRNNVAAQSEVAKNAWGEYAAGSGLNTGTSGQVELSRRNVLQGELAALDRSEAEALSEAELAATQLKTDYQNQVAAAIAKGEYERASALLDEYRTQESSAASVARAQADEDYRAWAARRSDEDTAYKRARDEEQSAYERELAEQKLQYQREQDAQEAERYAQEQAYKRDQDALEAERYEQQWAYQREQDAQEAQRYQKELEYKRVKDALDRAAEAEKQSYNRGQATAEAYLSAVEDRAKTLAKYGDFSGYAELGYSDEDISNMREVWEAQNPDIVKNSGMMYKVLSKYPDGVVTDTEDWLSLRDTYGEETLREAGISLDPAAYTELMEGMPKTFEEFVRATGHGEVMTWDEFRQTEKGYTDKRDYEKYLARMYNIYRGSGPVSEG